jgi:hypothetical protein
MLFFKEICEAMGYCCSCSARQPAELSCGFVSCQFSNFQKCMYMCTCVLHVLVQVPGTQLKLIKV